MRRGRSRSGGRRSTVAALALGATALALGGCAAPRLDYFPRQVITDEAHIAGATQRLEETVARAREPRIVEVSADARELY